MSPDDASNARLEALRQRWEADPSSRIFLQLAEEYRRAGRPEEAREVLLKGLEAHPNQVSALVALGRTLVDLGRPREAVEALDKAMAIDGTNPMAQKVAAIANLEMGDGDQARRHLDLYKLINASDPEIEELEARIDAPATEPPPLPPAGDGEAEEDDGGEDEEPSGWSPTAAWPELPGTESGLEAIGEEEEAAASSAADPAPAPAAPVSAADAGRPAGDGEEPFAHLYADGERRRYLSALAAEGIFPVDDEALDEATPAGADAESVAEGEERPTVTLGRLYLEQGHYGEAERIFAAVLERDADNGRAQLGLAQARASLALQEPAEAGEATPPGEADDAGWELEEVDVPPAAPTPAEEPTLVLEPPEEDEPRREPRRFVLTARQLLAGSDPEAPPKLALMRAYLDRIVARRGSGEQGPDVS